MITHAHIMGITYPTAAVSAGAGAKESPRTAMHVTEVMNAAGAAGEGE
jgi:hypothetical protein